MTFSNDGPKGSHVFAAVIIVAIVVGVAAAVVDDGYQHARHYEATVFNKTEDGRAINVVVMMDGQLVCSGKVNWLSSQLLMCDGVEDIEIDGEEHAWHVAARLHDRSTLAQGFTSSHDKLRFKVHDDRITMEQA